MSSIEQEGQLIKAKMSRYNAEIAVIKSEIGECEKTISEEQQLRQQSEQVVAELAKIEQANRELIEAKVQKLEIERILREGEYAILWRSKLSQLEKEIETLAYSEHAFADVQRLVEQLSPLQIRWENTLMMLRDAERIRKQLEKLKSDLSRLRGNEALEKMSARVSELRKRIDDTKYDERNTIGSK